MMKMGARASTVEEVDSEGEVTQMMEMGERASTVEEVDSEDEVPQMMEIGKRYEVDSDDEVTRMMEECGIKDIDAAKHRIFKKYYKLKLELDDNLDCYPRDWVGLRASAVPLCKEFDEDFFNEVMSAIDFAIQEINAKIGKTFKFVHVSHVAVDIWCVLLFTFTAREIVNEGDGPVKTFQAEVYFPNHEDPKLSNWRFKP